MPRQGPEECYHVIKPIVKQLKVQGRDFIQLFILLSSSVECFPKGEELVNKDDQLIYDQSQSAVVFQALTNCCSWNHTGRDWKMLENN